MKYNPIKEINKLYANCNSIDDKIDFINPLIHNSGMAKSLTKDGKKPCKYSSLDTFTEKLGIKVTHETYDEVKKWIENKYKDILKYQYDKLDHSSFPEYVKTNWGGTGTMYGKITGFTYTHWTVPLFNKGSMDMGIEWKTIRPDGNGKRWGNMWVCPGGDDRHKFGELHDLLTEITKEKYDSQPEVVLTKKQWENGEPGAAWAKNAGAHGFTKK